MPPERAQPPRWSQVSILAPRRWASLVSQAAFLVVLTGGWISACSLERRQRKYLWTEMTGRLIAPVSRVRKRNTGRDGGGGGNDSPHGVMDPSMLLSSRTSFSQPAAQSPHSLLSA